MVAADAATNITYEGMLVGTITVKAPHAVIVYFICIVQCQGATARITCNDVPNTWQASRYSEMKGGLALHCCRV